MLTHSFVSGLRLEPVVFTSRFPSFPDYDFGEVGKSGPNLAVAEKRLWNRIFGLSLRGCERFEHGNEMGTASRNGPCIHAELVRSKCHANV